MSKIEVNTIDTQCGSALQIGDGNTATIGLGKSGDTITIPCGATIVNSGTQTGFGRTGTVDWNTTKITADPANAVSGTGYFCDTSGGAFTVTLPTSPSAGDIVSVADYTRTFATYNLTIGRNSKPIGGVAQDGILGVDGQSATFVYVDGTEGWINVQETQTSQTGQPPYVAASGGNTTITCGDYKTHIFTAPGTFCVSSAGAAGGSNSVEHLTVAGGAAGGQGSGGGGGGAGGYRTTYPSPATAGTPVSIQGYPITVGAGGTAAPASATPAASGNGNDSVFSTITSTAGGGGGNENSCAAMRIGADGGSGGGGDYNSSSPGGSGNTPVVSPPQGEDGGQGGGTYSGGGGGGGTVAGAAGGGPDGGGDGGTGGPIADAYFGPTAPSYGTAGPVGSTRYFTGGGGGGSQAPAGPGGTGGSGGGGAGGMWPGSGTAGTTNTGGGGGGDGNTVNAANGGSGFVAIRYKFQ